MSSVNLPLRPAYTQQVNSLESAMNEHPASTTAAMPPDSGLPVPQRIVGQLVQKMKDALAACQPIAGSRFEAEVRDASEADVSLAVWALQQSGYDASASPLENGHHMVSMQC